MPPVDFGFCARVGEGKSCEDQVGTTHWMAPEVIKGARAPFLGAQSGSAC
jgi:serine/threonine protein kinase